MIHTYTYISIYMFSTYIYIYIYIYIFVIEREICIYVSICGCVYIYIYIYTHWRTKRLKPLISVNVRYNVCYLMMHAADCFVRVLTITDHGQEASVNKLLRFES